MPNPIASVTKTSVIGLGKLGSPLAACLAAKGFHTIGVDVDPDKVKAINEGRAPVFEPRLQDLIQSSRSCLTATLDIQEAVLKSEATFIIVPTPSEADGSFSLRFVKPVFQAIGEALRQKKDFHLVVLTSTVMPGAMGQELQPLIETASGLRAGVDFGLCYNPEFVALGSVAQDILNPDFILIGESDPDSGNLVEHVYQRLCDNSPAIARMNFVNAELTKLAVNTFVTTKISFANMLARICERLPQSDVNVVTSALGLDTRIGPRYLKGAISYGGPCFPRDNKALSRLAHNVGAPATIAEGTDKFNREDIDRLVEFIENTVPSKKAATIGILGLSYKPNTDVIEESPGVLLAVALSDKGYSTIVYDPAAIDNTRKQLGDKVQYADSMETCLNQADVSVITTPWQVFKSIEPKHFTAMGNRRVLIDCWRILDRGRFEQVVDYITLGTGA